MYGTSILVTVESVADCDEYRYSTVYWYSTVNFSTSRVNILVCSHHSGCNDISTALYCIWLSWYFEPQTFKIWIINRQMSA